MNNRAAIHLLITCIGILLYIPFIGSFHLFDWDEINFAEVAREMLVTKDYLHVQIGYETFWEKPPLFFWIQALFFKLFGISEFSARLPNALVGIVSINLLYYLGRKIQNHFTGIFWVIAFAGSIAPTLYFKSGIIDPLFNLWIFIAVYQLFRAEQSLLNRDSARVHYFLIGLFTGLALLTKGPVAVLIIALVWVTRIILNRRYAWAGFINLVVAAFTIIAIVSIWVIPEIVQRGPGFFYEFITYQTSLFSGFIEWHNQPWYYHIVVLLFLCFPASVFAIPHIFKNTSFAGTEKLFSAYMRALFWVVLVIFSIVSTKIIHYSSLCWLPLSWFAGIALYRWHTNRGKIHKLLTIPIILIAIIIGAGLTAVTLLLSHNSYLPDISKYINDEFAIATIANSSTWWGWEWAIGLFFSIGVLIWLIRFRLFKSSHPAVLFGITTIFSFLVYGFIIPPIEHQVQGNYINEIELLKNKKAYVESVEFKTYAIYFYRKEQPTDFVGPWLSNIANFNTQFNSKGAARWRYILDSNYSRERYIFTKISYKPDVKFAASNKLYKTIGNYNIWQKK